VAPDQARRIRPYLPENRHRTMFPQVKQRLRVPPHPPPLQAAGKELQAANRGGAALHPAENKIPSPRFPWRNPDT